MYKQFKQLSAFSITKEIKDLLTPEFLSEPLKQFAFRPCSDHESHQSGWIDPLGLGDQERFIVGGKDYLVLAYKTEVKRVPSSIITTELAKECDRMTESTGTPPGRKLKQVIKFEIAEKLLARAFPTSHVTMAIIDLACQRIYVGDTSSRSDEFLSALRKITGTLPVEPLRFAAQPELILTDWLKTSELPTGLALGSAVTLIDQCEKGPEIRFKNHALIGEEIQQALDTGKLVAMLELHYTDDLIFTLDAFTNTLKKLAFTDAFQEREGDFSQHEDDLLRVREAEALLTYSRISSFVADLMGVMSDV